MATLHLCFSIPSCLPLAAEAAARPTVKAIAAARPAARKCTLRDRQLAHFGVRVLPPGVKSYVHQTRANGRMRKITLG